MNDKITLKESRSIKDSIVNFSKPRRTRIRVVDHNTGEILQDIENKILVPGSQLAACNEFGLEQLIEFPSYNTELGLENSVPDDTEKKNNQIVCLWCAGRSGGLNNDGEVIACKNVDRIEPTDDIVPFRYVSQDNDLPVDLRENYFGRVVDDTGWIRYYFKRFDSEPQLHVRYLDGTEVSANMYKNDSSQPVEVYVEARMSVTRIDFRDYFDRVLGWDNGNISCIGLVTAWHDRVIQNPDADPADQIYYVYYQNILPYSKLNMKTEDLTDLNRAIDFIYQIFY